MKNKSFILMLIVYTVSIAIVITSAVFLYIKLNQKVSVNIDNKKTKVKFYYIYPDGSDNDKSIKNIIKNFNNSQDEILVEGYSSSTINKQLVTIMSGNSIDIGHNEWPNIIRWAQSGIIEPLNHYIEKDSYDMDDFLPTTRERTEYNGISYALPFYINTMALYYNIDMLNAAGFNSPPNTMDELKTMAQKLTKTSGNGEITVMGFLPDYPWTENVLWPIMFGAKFYDTEKNEVTTTSPEYIEAIEFQNWFYKQWGWENVYKFKLNLTNNEQAPFYTGKLAMAMGGEWVLNEIKKYAPDMKFGVCPFPYPIGKENLKGTSMITTSTFYISKGSAYKDSTWKFLKFLVSKESMISYCIDNNCLMARRSVLQSPATKDNPNLRFFSEFALNKNTTGFPPLPIVTDYLESLTEQTRLVFKQQKTPYEAMLSVKSKIDPLLKK